MYREMKYQIGDTVIAYDEGKKRVMVIQKIGIRDGEPDYRCTYTRECFRVYLSLDEERLSEL